MDGDGGPQLADDVTGPRTLGDEKWQGLPSREIESKRVIKFGGKWPAHEEPSEGEVDRTHKDAPASLIVSMQELMAVARLRPGEASELVLQPNVLCPLQPLLV